MSSPAASSATASPAVTSNVTTHPILGVLGVLLGAITATGAGRLLSVGLADLRGVLHLDVDSASWLTTSYNAAMMFIGPFSVYLGGVLGARRVLLACGVLFTLTTALLPFASNVPVLIALLLIAGLSGGTFYPLTLSGVLNNLPIKYVLLGIAMYSMDVLFATTVSTSLEAWYMNHWSWRWIFWNGSVLTPIMLVLIYFGFPWQPIPKAKEGEPKPTWRGFFFAGLGFALLVVALDQGQRLNWLNSSTIIALLVTGLFLLVAALIHYLILGNPRINLKFLMRRNTLLLALVVVFFDFSMLATVLLIPNYLGSVKGYLPLQSGPILLWVGLPQVLSGFLAMYLLKYIDARLMLTAGFSLIAIACLMNSQLSPAWSGTNFWLSQLILASGLAFSFNALVGAIILELLNTGALSRPFDSLAFGGCFQTVRLFGGQLAAAFMLHFLTVREQFHSNILGLGVQLGDLATQQRLFFLGAGMAPRTTGANMVAGRALELLHLQVKQQAFTLAIADSFRLVAWSSVCCLILVACTARVPTQFQRVIATVKKA